MSQHGAESSAGESSDWEHSSSGGEDDTAGIQVEYTGPGVTFSTS
jgi:hypothetical protein